MDINKQEMFERIAIDFSRAVSEFRKARNETNIPNSLFKTEEEEEKEYQEYKSRINSLSTSKDYIKLPRVEFWELTMKAKIQTIACIGGFSMMQDFDSFLYKHPLNEKLNLESAFDYYADGIGGWCR